MEALYVPQQLIVPKSRRSWIPLALILLALGQGTYIFLNRRCTTHLMACCDDGSRNPVALASSMIVEEAANLLSSSQLETNNNNNSKNSNSNNSDAVKNEPAIKSAPIIWSNRTSTPTKMERYYKKRNVTDNSFDGVNARAFPSWPADQPLPCPEAESNWDAWPGPNTKRSDDGMLFLKPYKAGSSTSVGVHLRISRSVARRQNKTLCKMRFDHNKAWNVFPQRHRKKSFLWTIARDPTSRIVSYFFHFSVSRGKREPSFDSFMKTLTSRRWDSFENYYLEAFSPTKRTPSQDPVALANDIFEYYDFIAVTERMDESVVVLSMLMGIPVSDVLYLKSKGRGGYDDAGGRSTKICTYIWPSFTTPAMEEYFTTDDFQDMIRWDRAIHQAANRSLDLTIDRLGRNLVEQKLAEYQKLKQIATDICVPETTFLCSSEGAFSKVNDCMWTDSSCNNECLDRVVEEQQERMRGAEE